MWWRIVRRNRWTNANPVSATDIAKAAEDVDLRDGDDGLSVFAVADANEALQVAQFFGLNCRSRPQLLDYMLIPGACFANLGLRVTPTPLPKQLHPFLSDRHHEVAGIAPEVSHQLARALLLDP